MTMSELAPGLVAPVVVEQPVDRVAPRVSHARAKRVLDFSLSLLAILMLLPVFVVLALTVRTTSRGPVLFKQERVGRGGRSIVVYKFRSMVAGAENLLDDLASLNEVAEGPLFKVRQDPRITPVGRWMRRFSLDELPQLLNVLEGSMSLVGPRPALPTEVAQYTPTEQRRLWVKPGLTGLWQVSGRSDLPWDEGIRLDLSYVEQASLGMDLSILARTIPAVIRARGAYYRHPLTSTLRRAVLVIACLVAGAVVASLTIGLTHRSDPARAQVDARCTNDAATDLGVLTKAIRGSKAGDAVVIRGHCLVSGTVKLLGGRTYRGETRTTQNHVGSTIEQAPNTTMPALMASESWVEDWEVAGEPIAIRDLSLRGNGAAATSGIVLRSWSSLVDNVHVRGVGQDGIRISNLSADGKTALTSSLVNGTISNSFIEFAGRHGIAAIEADGNSVTDWSLQNNSIGSSGHDGIHLDNAAGWAVSHNHMYANGRNGIFAAKAWGTTIHNNYIEDFGRTAVDGLYRGIFIGLHGGSSGSTVVSNRVFSFNGSVSDAGSSYRFIEAAGRYGHGAVVVNSNLAVSSAAASNRLGLCFSRGSATSLEVVSAANLVKGFGTGNDRVVGPGVTFRPGM